MNNIKSGVETAAFQLLPGIGRGAGLANIHDNTIKLGLNIVDHPFTPIPRQTKV